MYLAQIVNFFKIRIRVYDENFNFLESILLEL